MSVMRERLGQFCVIVVRFLFRTQSDSNIVQEFERIEWNLPPRAIKMVVGDVLEWSPGHYGRAIDDIGLTTRVRGCADVVIDAEMQITAPPSRFWIEA
jgi:hypothetical protein